MRLLGAAPVARYRIAGKSLSRTLIVIVMLCSGAPRMQILTRPEAPLAFGLDSNFVFLCWLGCLPELLLARFSLLAQFLSQHP